MSLTAIRAALVSRYEGAGLNLPTSYQGRKFNQPVGEPWARVGFVPNTPEVRTLGDAGEDEATGILQIDLFHPLESGIGGALAMADTLRSVFKAGGFEYSGQSVTIVSAGPGFSREENGWTRTTITINWNARIQR